MSKRQRVTWDSNAPENWSAKRLQEELHTLGINVPKAPIPKRILLNLFLENRSTGRESICVSSTRHARDRSPIRSKQTQQSPPPLVGLTRSASRGVPTTPISEVSDNGERRFPGRVRVQIRNIIAHCNIYFDFRFVFHIQIDVYNETSLQYLTTLFCD